MSKKQFRNPPSTTALAPLPENPTVPIELQELSILDEKNQYSLLNLLPADVGRRLIEVPTEMWAMSEDDFLTKYNPTDVDIRLKLKFWDEWQRALLTTGGVIQIQTVYYGICTREHFYELIKIPHKLAFIVIPPTDYEMSLKELLYRGLRRIREIINLPIVFDEPVFYKGQPVLDANGHAVVRKRVDKGLVSEIRQVVTILADRVHGALVHRIELNQKSISLQASVSAQLPAGAPTDPLPTLQTDELTRIDAELDKINQKLLPADEIQSAQDRSLARQLKPLGLTPEDVIHVPSTAGP